MSSRAPLPPPCSPGHRQSWRGTGPSIDDRRHRKRYDDIDERRSRSPVDEVKRSKSPGNVRGGGVRYRDREGGRDGRRRSVSPRDRERERDRDRERDRERDRDRDRDYRRRGGGPDTVAASRRYRSRTPPGTRRDRDRDRDRDRKRSISRDRDRDRGRRLSRDPSPPHKSTRDPPDIDMSDANSNHQKRRQSTPPTAEEILEEENPEDTMAEMAKVMGFTGGFGSTHGKKVKGNDVYSVGKDKQAKYRQYMNRVGGFNRALSPS